MPRWPGNAPVKSFSEWFCYRDCSMFHLSILELLFNGWIHVQTESKPYQTSVSLLTLGRTSQNHDFKFRRYLWMCLANVRLYTSLKSQLFWRFPVSLQRWTRDSLSKMRPRDRLVTFKRPLFSSGDVFGISHDASPLSLSMLQFINDAQDTYYYCTCIHLFCNFLDFFIQRVYTKIY